MYDYFVFQPDGCRGNIYQPGRDPALFHCGDYRGVLLSHLDHAYRLATEQDSAPPIGPFLYKRICDARVLRCAFDELVAKGGQAPGPSGLVLEDLDDSAGWSVCRALADAMRRGSYQPGLDRHVQISKGAGRGFRTLTIQNVEDRLVTKAMLLVLQPVVDPTFQWGSMGCRPHRGPLQALAAALTLAEVEKRTVWVSADVAKAFDKVPFTRLITACRRHAPGEVVELIRLVSDLGQAKGIRQGSPMSPFLWNVFADRYIDQPFVAKAVPGQLLRYVDDILVLCTTRPEADEALAQLTLIARSAGTPLKPNAEVAALDAGGSLTWLGYHVQRSRAGMAVTIAPKAWDRLAEHLSAAHLVPAAPLRAIAVVQGWLGYQGPCFKHEARGKVINKIQEMAEHCGFSEIPARYALEAVWEKAWATWSRIMEETAALVRRNTTGSQEPHLALDACAPWNDQALALPQPNALTTELPAQGADALA